MRRPHYVTQTLPTNYLPKRGISRLGCIAIAATESPMAKAMATVQMPSHIADLPQLAEATNALGCVWFLAQNVKIEVPSTTQNRFLADVSAVVLISILRQHLVVRSRSNARKLRFSKRGRRLPFDKEVRMLRSEIDFPPSSSDQR